MKKRWIQIKSLFSHRSSFLIPGAIIAIIFIVVACASYLNGIFTAKELLTIALQVFGASALVLTASISWDRYKRNIEYKNLCILISFETYKNYSQIALNHVGMPGPEKLVLKTLAWDTHHAKIAQFMVQKEYAEIHYIYNALERLNGSKIENHTKLIEI